MLTDEQKRERIVKRIGWPLAIVWCGYFVVAGSAASVIAQIFATLFAGLGLLQIQPNSSLFLVASHYVYLISALIAFPILLTITEQIEVFSERYRRLLRLFLITLTMGSLPLVLIALGLALYRPTFHLIGKLAQ
jgi:hypothetical protein